MDGRRAILLTGGGNKPYDQAIFIVPGNVTKLPRDVVAEAEKIVNDFLSAKEAMSAEKINVPAKASVITAPRRKSRKLDIFLSLAAMSACVILAIMFYYANFV